MTNTDSAIMQVSRRHKYGAFVVVMAGVVLGTLDSSIVNVSYPTIARDFNVRVEDVVWAGIVYTMATGALALGMGRFADRFGHRRMYVLGFGLFAVATLLCGFAPSLFWLCAARTVQGAAYAMILGNGLALLALVFPPAQRGRALGAVPLAVGVGITSGPVLGGWITETWSWPWIFFIMVPVAVVLCIGAIVLLPRRTKTHGPLRLDLAGLVAAGVATITLVLGMRRIAAAVDPFDPQALSLLGACALSIALFIRIERRAKWPLVPLDFALRRVFFFTTAAGVLSITLIFSQLTLIPFMMEQLYGFSQSTSGMVLLVSPIMLSIMGPVSGWITDRVGLRVPLSVLGLAIGSTAPLLIAFAPDQAEPWQLAWRVGFLGLGMGLFQTPNTTKIMNLPPRDLMGAVSGLQASIRTAGMTVGLALAGICVPLFYTLSSGDAPPPVKDLRPTSAAFDAFRHSLYVTSGIGLLAIACILLTRDRKTA